MTANTFFSRKEKLAVELFILGNMFICMYLLFAFFQVTWRILQTRKTDALTELWNFSVPISSA